jgi:cytochrome o ubiquinol oxidase operon protein cyoD
MPTLKTYVTGFVASLVLTLGAYFAVVYSLLSGNALIVLVLVLAVVQLLVQLVFFLHLLEGEDRRWNMVVLASTLTIVLILVVGSIWIMNHLNYSMTPSQINNYMNDQGGAL